MKKMQKIMPGPAATWKGRGNFFNRVSILPRNEQENGKYFFDSVYFLFDLICG